MPLKTLNFARKGKGYIDRLSEVCDRKLAELNDQKQQRLLSEYKIKTVLETPSEYEIQIQQYLQSGKTIKQYPEFFLADKPEQDTHEIAGLDIDTLRQLGVNY
jgi:hypothetical protein